jgi:CheY-like chemotaxis protein
LFQAAYRCQHTDNAKNADSDTKQGKKSAQPVFDKLGYGYLKAAEYYSEKPAHKTNVAVIFTPKLFPECAFRRCFTIVYLLNFGGYRCYLSNTIVNESCLRCMAKILLIDDDPDVRTVMTLALNRQGHEVDTASSRDEALVKLESGLPALILLDVLLSGFDGREFCRELKANNRTQRIPVIMLSGHPGASSRFENYGADDFIAKPVNMQALLQKMTDQISVER